MRTSARRRSQYCRRRQRIPRLRPTCDGVSSGVVLELVPLGVSEVTSGVISGAAPGVLSGIFVWVPGNPTLGEPPQDCRMLSSLRGCGHEEVSEVLSGGTGAGNADGVRARTRAHLAVSCDCVDCREDRVHPGDAGDVGATDGDRHRTVRWPDKRCAGPDERARAREPRAAAGQRDPTQSGRNSGSQGDGSRLTVPIFVHQSPSKPTR